MDREGSLGTLRVDLEPGDNTLRIRVTNSDESFVARIIRATRGSRTSVSIDGVLRVDGKAHTIPSFEITRDLDLGAYIDLAAPWNVDGVGNVILNVQNTGNFVVDVQVVVFRRREE